MVSVNVFMGALFRFMTLGFLWLLREIKVENIRVVKGTLMSFLIPEFGITIFNTQSGNCVPTNLGINMLIQSWMRRAYRWIDRAGGY